jgi:hypothetical protein
VASVLKRDPLQPAIETAILTSYVKANGYGANHADRAGAENEGMALWRHEALVRRQEASDTRSARAGYMRVTLFDSLVPGDLSRGDRRRE